MVEISIKKRPCSEAVVTQRKFFKKTAKGKVIKGAGHISLCAQFLMIDKFSAKDTCGTMLAVE
jgi:hypothetical protein